jgi:hypothetical protein
MGKAPTLEELTVRLSDLEHNAEEERAETFGLKATLRHLLECELGTVARENPIHGVPRPTLRHPALSAADALATDACAANSTVPAVQRYREALQSGDQIPEDVRQHLLAGAEVMRVAAERRAADRARDEARAKDLAAERTRLAIELLHVDDAEQAAPLAVHLGPDVDRAWKNRASVFLSDSPTVELEAAIDQSLAKQLESTTTGGRPAISWVHSEMQALGAEEWRGRDGRFQGFRLGPDAPAWQRVRLLALVGLRDALIRVPPSVPVRAALVVIGMGADLVGHPRLEELARRPGFEWASVVGLAPDDDARKGHWVATGPQMLGT